MYATVDTTSDHPEQGVKVKAQKMMGALSGRRLANRGRSLSSLPDQLARLSIAMRA